jgi:murein DD-endopeptidase MepM/ murein hydrolase activator NlpD
VVSGFRVPQRPDHDGIDIAAPKGTRVHAAAAGTVVTVRCNAYLPDGSPYSCDVGGSSSVLGCGWYLELQHADGTVTRYCHLATAPFVEEGEQVHTGQVIGVVGSGGHSSGPHLHLETHTGHPATPENAVEPIEYFAARGVRIA